MVLDVNHALVFLALAMKQGVRVDALHHNIPHSRIDLAFDVFSVLAAIKRTLSSIPRRELAWIGFDCFICRAWPIGEVLAKLKWV
jgi:hypothetical protein